jgi:polysaccharide deacetylase 2 family uncharacterized protein YibQ
MAKRKPILNRLDLVFWGLLAVAMVLGGGEAVSGLPRLAGLLMPEGPAAAEANSDVAYGQFDRPLGRASRYQPVVLQPVQSHAMPDWMAMRQGAQGLPPARTAAATDHIPKIAIVIDDMGGEVAQSQRAISLPNAISLSFLPYPDSAPALARAAYREGHEVLVHVPMEPVGTADPGPNALRTDLSGEENIRRLDWDLSRIEGFDGINNHEGSKFTADRAALAPVIGALAERHVFFLDSRTLPTTQVVAVARAFGVESAGRDVFLDDVDRPDAIDAQLRAVEQVARLQGVAIAIGHPRVNTLDALWRWTGEAASRGYRLIPVRDAVRLKTQREIKEAAVGK